VSERPKRPATLSRRRFVAVVAAGSAAILARPVEAAAAAAKAAAPAKKAPAAPAMSVVQRKEYDRQRASTLETLKAIRAHAMPPGTEMASVFRVRRPAKKAR
jgi:hypothetical protein